MASPHYDLLSLEASVLSMVARDTFVSIPTQAPIAHLCARVPLNHLPVLFNGGWPPFELSPARASCLTLGRLVDMSKPLDWVPGQPHGNIPASSATLVPALSYSCQRSLVPPQPSSLVPFVMLYPHWHDQVIPVGLEAGSVHTQFSTAGIAVN